MRYSLASARYVLAGQRDPRMDKLTWRVDATRAVGMTRTEISALFGRNLKKDVLGELLDRLLSGGEYEEIPSETGGRPAQRYRKRLSS